MEVILRCVLRHREDVSTIDSNARRTFTRSHIDYRVLADNNRLKTRYALNHRTLKLAIREPATVSTAGKRLEVVIASFQDSGTFVGRKT